MNPVDALPFWSCYLLEAREPALRIPVCLPHLQQLVLDDKLAPDFPVADGETLPDQPLRNRPDLVPFGSLRRSEYKSKLVER